MATSLAQSSSTLASLDQKVAALMGVVAGAKAAIVASIATAIPTMASVRMLPWARANLNHVLHKLSLSPQKVFLSINSIFVNEVFDWIAVAGAAYFIVADKTVLATARKNSFKHVSNMKP
ncbi:hypothetical protein Gogos_004368 [Gossypium gossypioides]|uniref:Uncharacterized protein n=1 Tax=Gossypium gossypioides TaxID=34282 RepID=A0A7J9CH50_GOSGO|nr:hypothetical protein [Gossypium gossypioides]